MYIYKQEKYSTIERIGELMKKHNPEITQRDLSIGTGISENAISAWFKKDIKIRKSNLKLVADFLNCDLEFLTCEQNYPHKYNSSQIKLIEPTFLDLCLPKIKELMELNNHNFSYSYNFNTDAEIITDTFIKNEIRYYYETVEYEYKDKVSYTVSINDSAPKEKSKEDMEDFIKSILKYISYEISQL